MTGIQGQDVAAHLEALSATKESVAQDLVIRVAMDVESVPREFAAESESMDNNRRYHSVRALLQVSHEVPSRLLPKCGGTSPLVVPTLGRRACACAPVQRLKAVGAVRAVRDRRLARGRSPAPHARWG